MANKIKIVAHLWDNKETFLSHCFRWMALAGLLCAIGAAHAASSSFTFILDEPCKTSAGVFAPDGTLVRTLWSKVRYAAGTNSAVWDGLDDNSNAVSAGAYQIRVLQHNTEYVWDGAIGNTSAELSGPSVHTGFYPMRDMAISGTNAFYVSGYNEGMYDFRSVFTTDPQRIVLKWSPDNQPANIYDRNWSWTVPRMAPGFILRAVPPPIRAIPSAIIIPVLSSPAR